ncbi:mobilization protein [Laspinema olomoucense]|uniref:mobilization protein n=1 Tax=Laspinema olomoucense TaxID=3231600 RepID=UPI0021BABE42|nr:MULTISPECIES: mobilization protein [unclassified Laspinema]MCT7975827.1 mobilization protein [Laspinema sp. D3d]MCT7996566.1 mobilization protein [Laspinema sp. D3c]
MPRKKKTEVPTIEKPDNEVSTNNEASTDTDLAEQQELNNLLDEQSYPNNLEDEHNPVTEVSVDIGSQSYIPHAPSTRTIHIWGGERGGAGKSTGCRVMADYLLNRSIPFCLVDTDRSRPDVKAYYGEKLGENCVEAYFSEAEYKSNNADIIFELAMKKNVLVNLPAQVAVPFQEWVQRNCLKEVAEEMKVRFVLWFACTGEMDSLQLFEDSLNQYPWIEHVLVKNLGISDPNAWNKILSSKKFNDLQQSPPFKQIELPKFYARDRDIIEEEPMPLSEAITTQQRLGILGCKRTQKFLDNCAMQFEGTGYFGATKEGF